MPEPSDYWREARDRLAALGVEPVLAWRTRDRDDVDSILAVGHELDEEYIEGWAREWQVLDRWREARS